MSCYGCGEKFTFFRKEVSCKKCSFSFCSKCCSEKVKFPNGDNKLHTVCFKCKKEIENGESKKPLERDHELPKNFLKLVETNRNKERETKPQFDENKHLVDRLEKLNKSSNPKPVQNITDKELEERLLRLTYGDNIPKQTQEKQPQLPKEEIKTPEDIINQAMNEVELEKKYQEYEKNEIEKLENRLNNLKPSKAEASPSTEEDKNPTNTDTKGKKESVPAETTEESELSDENINKMVEKMLKEFKEEEDEKDEDSWCCICNEDADLKCMDCDEDYYCKRCYKATHVGEEYKYHTKKNIKKK